MAAKTRAVSYWPRPTLIKNPSPRSDPTNSPTTAPITDNVAPTRKPPRNTGRAAGTSNNRRVCCRLACRLRIRSLSVSGTARTPTIVLIKMGKKTIKEQIRIFENNPGPNQMINNGAIATSGIAWLATRYGERNLSEAGDLASRYPRTVAQPAPKIRPMTTSKRVISKCRIRLPSETALKNRIATKPGPGRMKAGNFHIKMADSHTPNAMIMERMKNNVRCLLSLMNKTKTPIHDSSGRICRQAVYTLSAAFFFPDFTVGPGISPDHVLTWTRGLLLRVTTDRELDLPIRTLPRRYLYYTCFFSFCSGLMVTIK
jgi:hypothetical protein